MSGIGVKNEKEKENMKTENELQEDKAIRIEAKNDFFKETKIDGQRKKGTEIMYGDWQRQTFYLSFPSSSDGDWEDKCVGDVEGMGEAYHGVRQGVQV